MSVSEPSKILTPWAASGLKNTIPPTANPVTGNAGYDQGFPAINMTAKEAGGIPPFGQDFNGILNDITKILQFTQAGGIPAYSSTLASSVGGYAKGAVVMSSNGSTLWQNTVNGNSSNPDSGGINWVDLILKILPKRVFSANDFIRIPDAPGGLILQWGTATGSASGYTNYNFPIAFPNAALCVICSAKNTTNVGYMAMNNGTLTATQFGTAVVTTANVFTASGFSWFAAGY